jgi:divalent metal cation (Fe/Co/Zn/Cd) transporter
MAEKKKEKKGKKEKPLEKWTVKEMREECLKVGGIHGVHGMNKEELLAALRKEKGIEAPKKKTTVNVREIKAKIVDMKKKRDEERANNVSRAQLNILRRKISRLKKKTRDQG